MRHPRARSPGLRTAAIALLVFGSNNARADAGGDGGPAPEEVTVVGQRTGLDQPAVSKTGTKLEDLPSSVQVVGRALLDTQGATALKDAITDASGISQGGTDSYGFDDKFVVRGLDARIYNDGFSDGDQRNGIPHSLNGVERVEILKGPGSALFGSGPPGGTINVVHYLPSDTLGYGGSVQAGSFGSVTTSVYGTGPTGVPGLDFRVDGLIQHSDGFRSLASNDDEIRPEFSWSVGRHFFTISLDARYIEATPDPAGLIYVNGRPIEGVSRDTKYSTPFSHGDQSLERLSAGDVWTVSPYLTVNNRLSYMHHDLSILRNGDAGTVTGDVLSGRQLREQHDDLDDFDYQLEPVWKFETGSIGHTLLTGFEIRREQLFTDRATADLPNITDIFDPVIPETSPSSLHFLRDAKHAGLVDNLDANYVSLYATDQIDVTDRLKLRFGARQDWWDSDLTPQVFVPGRLLPSGQQLFQPGVTYGRRDAPLSWNAGILYKVLPEVAPFFGVAKSNLANFTSESTVASLAAPESALEYEGGIKASGFGDRATVTVAGFDVTRKNVFALVGDVPFFNNQETYGAEADVNVELTPVWRVNANFTAQHAELTDNPSSPTSIGKEPVGVARTMAHLWTSYDFSIGDTDGFRIGGGLNYRGKIYGNTLNTDVVPSYVTADAVLSYTRDRYTLSLGAKNLGNTTYFVAANGAGAYVGDPLTVFASASVRFGG